MKKCYLSVFALCALMSSCKKDDKDSDSATFKAIADKKWQLTAYNYNYMGADYDGYSSMSDCQKDNTWTMKSDKTNEGDEGATKCNASDPQTKTAGTWELRSEGKELFVKDFGGAVVGISELTFTILETSSTTLKLRYTTTVNGPTIVNTATYTAK